jgi:hypothetical protein
VGSDSVISALLRLRAPRRLLKLDDRRLRSEEEESDDDLESLVLVLDLLNRLILS